ncbi:glycosyltransferase family 4 protein [Leptolyngbya ohadii]|uniref:glycosyltransferase family 4 protein n=1 Tax=Leptolyngbya ohadii TaxID=1962290 RepID=UPI0015C5AA32|nr:glycosyltransferase family 4 protein [Leptolyngbya ohadii]
MNRAVRSFSTSQWYRTSSLELEWALLQQLRRKDIDLVHFLWGERDLGYFPIVKLFNAKPLCCTFHACQDDLPQILAFKERLRSLNAIIIMSETQRAFFESAGIPSDKIHFIPHGIDTDFFTPPAVKKTLDEFTVLSVGSYRRNFLLLREVALKLRSHRDIKIKFVGAKAFSEHFSDLDNVEFLNRLTDLELLQLYQSASCLVLAIENATANNALLESLACGLPVVAEKVGGIPEYANSDCAVMVEEGNADQMVEAIVELSESQVRQEQMAQSARKRALELSWSNTAIQTEKLYASMLNSL